MQCTLCVVWSVHIHSGFLERQAGQAPDAVMQSVMVRWCCCDAVSDVIHGDGVHSCLSFLIVFIPCRHWQDDCSGRIHPSGQCCHDELSVKCQASSNNLRAAWLVPPQPHSMSATHCASTQLAGVAAGWFALILPSCMLSVLPCMHWVLSTGGCPRLACHSSCCLQCGRRQSSGKTGGGMP